MKKALISRPSLLLGTLLPAALAVPLAGGVGRAAPTGGAAPSGSSPAAAPSSAPTNCKAYGGGRCCDPAVTRHLTKEAVFSACGESDASFLGEKAGKESCRYLFKGEGGEEAFVEVYAPAQKEVPSAPNDPFFSWKKVGKVFVTDKAASPKSAPMLASATGLWLPGAGFIVSVNASTKVCTKGEATRLAKSVR